MFEVVENLRVRVFDTNLWTMGILKGDLNLDNCLPSWITFRARFVSDTLSFANLNTSTILYTITIQRYRDRDYALIIPNFTGMYHGVNGDSKKI